MFFCSLRSSGLKDRGDGVLHWVEADPLRRRDLLLCPSLRCPGRAGDGLRGVPQYLSPNGTRFLTFPSFLQDSFRRSLYRRSRPMLL